MSPSPVFAHTGSDHVCDISDHTHETALDDGMPVRVTQFDFDALDPEVPSLVPIDTIAAGFIKILAWVQGGAESKSAGARLGALQVLLDPVHGRYRSLAEVSREFGISRAALSKALIDLRDDYGIRMGLQLPSGRQNCAAAQKLALQNGTHASNKTRRNHKMNQSAKTRYPTLDKASDRIAELEGQLEKARTAKPVAQTATTVTTPKPAVAPATKPAPAAAPRLSDLNRSELVEVLDEASRTGNQQLVAKVYSELNARRRPI